MVDMKYTHIMVSYNTIHTTYSKINHEVIGNKLTGIRSRVVNYQVYCNDDIAVNFVLYVRTTE